MSPEQEVRRGEDARLLLAHPLLLEAFATIEQELTDTWKASPARDVDAREKLWLSLKLLHRVQTQLQSVVETGQVAKATLAEQALELARRAGRTLSGY